MLRLEVRGLDKVERLTKNAKRLYPIVMNQALDRSGMLLTAQMKRNIRRNKSIYTGELVGSIHQELMKPAGTGVTVYVGARHGIFVEKGTRPHFPPVAPLERWARLKLGQTGLGYVIARAISKKGTKPHPYAEPALQSETNDIVRLIHEAVKTVLRKA